MELTKISLFAGIGGDDLASEWAGIETICFVEIDEFCQRVLRYHWSNIPIIGDIHDVTREKVKELTGRDTVDIISGGDPCQPRSVAGKRRGRKDDRDLWPDMFRIIQEFKPAWIVNENPTGRLTMDFHEVLFDLESAGYETRSFVIPACAINAPHRRDRVFIVANNNKIRCSGRAFKEKRIQRQVTSFDKTDSIPTEIISYSKCDSLQRGQAIWKEECGNTRDKQLPGFLQFDFKHEISSARVYRDLHGVSTRMDRHRNEALGNAVVPQQIYPIYNAIVEVEMNKKRKSEKPFTEVEFENLVDKASQPLEPERKPDSKEAETSGSETSDDCSGSHTR